MKWLRIIIGNKKTGTRRLAANQICGIMIFSSFSFRARTEKVQDAVYSVTNGIRSKCQRPLKSWKRDKDLTDHLKNCKNLDRPPKRDELWTSLYRTEQKGHIDKVKPGNSLKFKSHFVTNKTSFFHFKPMLAGKFELSQMCFLSVVH